MKFRPFSDLVANPKAPEYLIDGILECGTVCVLLAESGNYKTFLAVDFALSVATGRPWHGRTVKAGAVFYLNGEGHGGFYRRLIAWGLRNKELDANLWVSDRSVCIDQAKEVAEVRGAIEKICKESGATPVLIVIDTLPRHMAGDENQAKDMGAFIEGVAQLLPRDYPLATVLINHHPGHSDKTRERGSYSLRAAVDTRMILRRPEGTALQAYLEFQKVKDGEVPKPILLRLVSVDIGIKDAADEPVTSLVIDSIDSETTTPAGKKTRAADRAFEILEQIIRDSGQGSAPEDAWRLACAGRLSESSDQNSQDKAYRRARAALLEKSWIEIRGGFVLMNRSFRTASGPSEPVLSAVRTDKRTDNTPPIEGVSVRSPGPNESVGVPE